MGLKVPPSTGASRSWRWISCDLQCLRVTTAAVDQGEVAESRADEADTGWKAVDLKRRQRQRGIATDRGEACEPQGADPNGVDLLSVSVKRGSSGAGGRKH
jgi:hypothetical protein